MEKIIEMAKKARDNAYAPYSKFSVGAVLVCKNGKMYTGCNVENHGIMSICAERVAFTKAISEGEKDFAYLVVCGATPCGYCRQFMTEFVNDDFIVYIVDDNDKITEYKMKDLLPNSFKF